MDLCPGCGSDKYVNRWCQACGHREIGVADRVVFTDEVKVTMRHGEPGHVGPFGEVSRRRKWNHDRQQTEERIIVVNKDIDYYSQQWSDPATGEITFQKAGRLSDPELHSKSARHGRAAGDDDQVASD